ncbi:hypothetical protein L1281_002400 [Neisseria sp. HSC-16F19]|nr:hypothetical protein [Neisseria sp. HSC-16F19]MCP2041784.1 hypothetical protein [Neisseria sp. HSC-16F19]
MLGQYGLPESRVLAMPLPELDAFMRQARQLQAGLLLPRLPLVRTTATPSSPVTAAKGGTTYISKRRKT